MRFRITEERHDGLLVTKDVYAPTILVALEKVKQPARLSVEEIDENGKSLGGIFKADGTREEVD